MSTQHQIVDLPGGSSKLERIFVASDPSRVAPTNEADVSQYGVEPGAPEPDASNGSSSGVSLGLVGRLRQDASSDPTVVVRIEDSAAIGVGASQADLDAGRISVAGFLTAAGARTRARVPRYSVKRTGYDQASDDTAQIGISTSWSLFQEFSVDPPGEGASEVDEGPDVAVDRHGNLLIAWQATETGTSKAFAVVYRYKPGSSATAQHLLTIDIDAASGRSSVVAGDVELVRYGQEIYLLVGVRDAATKSALQVYLLSGTDGDSPEATYITETFTTSAGYTPIMVAATETDAGVLVALQESAFITPIRLGMTRDMRTFDEVEGAAGIVSLGEFDHARPKLLLGEVKDIIATSSTDMWAVTGNRGGEQAGGEVLHSVDGGKSWRGVEAPTPAIANLGRAVGLNSIAKSSGTLLAVGEGGCIIRSTDSGTTWKVIRYAATAHTVFYWGPFTSTQIEAGLVRKTDIPAVAYHKVKMISATRAWAVGDKGTIIYTEDAGDNWSTIRFAGSAGAYRDFVVDGAASGNVLLAVGEIGVHDSSDITAADHSKLAVIVTDAEDAGSAAFAQVLSQSTVGDASAVAIAIERNGTNPSPIGASAIGYVLGESGKVVRFEGDGATAAFTEISQLAPRDYIFTDIESPDQATGGTTGDVVVTAQATRGPGLVYQSTSAHTGTNIAFSGVAPIIDASCAWMFDADIGVIGTSSALFRAKEAQNIRAYPELMTLPGGAILLGVYNASKTWVEIYRSERPGPGEQPSFGLVKRIKTTAAMAPKFAMNVDGTVVLAVGRTHWFGLSGGREWVIQSDPRIPVPINDHSTTSDYTDHVDSLRSKRALAEYNGGVLWSAVRSVDGTKIGLHRCWHWDSGGSYYRPIVSGVPLSLGVDSVAAIFDGDPVSRDVWTIRPRYLYRASHLATDSPTAETWRSKDDDSQIVIEYDAQDDSVVDVLGGARRFWTASFFGLFGGNFARASFAISDPSNDASFTTRDITVLLDSGIAAGPASALTSNILIVSGKDWTPDQWAPGTRRFFVRFANQSLSYRILRNGADWIEIDGAADLSGTTLQKTFFVYSDRICWRGDSGSGPGSGGLLGTDYEHGRIIKATVPAQSTPDGYFEAGRFFVGREVPASGNAYSFLYGARCLLVTNTAQDVSLGGIKNVRHYGRTGRLYELKWPHQSPDEVGRKLNALLPKLREPFVIAWDGSDMQTCTLVRLVDASEISNTMGNYFDVPFLLEEIQ